MQSEARNIHISSLRLSTPKLGAGCSECPPAACPPPPWAASTLSIGGAVAVALAIWLSETSDDRHRHPERAKDLGRSRPLLPTSMPRVPERERKAVNRQDPSHAQDDTRSSALLLHLRQRPALDRPPVRATSRRRRRPS